MTTTTETMPSWKENAIRAARVEQARLAIEEAERQQEAIYKKLRELQAWRAKFRTALLSIGVTGADSVIENATPDYPTVEVDGVEFVLYHEGQIRTRYGCKSCGKLVIVTIDDKIQLGNALIDMVDYVCQPCQIERMEAEEREQTA